MSASALCLEHLRTIEPFNHLPTERLAWVCDRATSLQLHKGDYLVKEGDLTTTIYVIALGRLGITRQSEGIAIPIGQHDGPGYIGEIPVLTDEPAPVTIQAMSDCQIHSIAGADFLTLLHECRDFERQVFRLMQKRVRGLESFLRGREKMAALGTLSAGLAHELNNPAAALVRSLSEVVPAIRELEKMNMLYGQQQPDEADVQQWQQVRDAGYDTILKGGADAVTLSDREEELLDWLEDYGVAQAWKLAEPLALAGIDIPTLERLIAPWRDNPTQLRDMGIRWLALSFEMMSMIQSGQSGAERIATLVKSMKSYSYMDQGAQQMVDLHQGLEDTLRLFAFKLKQGITVERDYDATLPKLMAHGSELNQVWTNLIDNAIDAIGDKGTLTLRTCHFQGDARVEIIDTGPGIPPEIKSRIYEPFFTTKGVGKGSGLGLETVLRIVENRHHGTIGLESAPGHTCFAVCLPLGKAEAS
ncbi:cyclic nucleotide-binding domain-containing protein [Nodosilinea sp. LEGE 07298]|uniref:ATP-binding protein n=1 Tax=Nodosilinea sp. LEGE 07298 TaxID=2777970 RepID=UPI00187F476D|nr:ATP-binding protein [Nodosilinea sp. LEGE 07298]MBE9111009.1 cyclic nucleotide-binding domain-containing protein [Nodosilinea sp. LEGE 07298]